MCLLFVYINPNPTKNQYRLIVVSNRDETYARPTQQATEWKGEAKIIAGTDLQEERQGGTWLGLSDTGRVANLLNILKSRSTFKEPATVQGRGFIVVDYLRGKLSGEEYMKQLTNSNVQYNDFNFLIMEPETTNPNSKCSSGAESSISEISSASEMSSSDSKCPSTSQLSSKNQESESPNPVLPYKLLYMNNYDNEVVSLGPGFHGFGNSFLCKPFNKTRMGKEKFEKIVKEHGLTIDNQDKLIEELFVMMQDKVQYFPDEIISTQGEGYPEYFHKALSAIFVTCLAVQYGTRTTTLVLVDSNNRAIFHEKTMKEPISHDNIEWLNTRHNINIVSR